MSESRQQRRARERAEKKAQRKSLYAPEDLYSFYWGYKADQGTDGFEFSSKTCEVIGIPKKEALKIGRNIKKAADYQIRALKTNSTEKLFGQSREEFIADEYQRMLGTTKNLNELMKQNKPVQLADVFKDIMIFCCAVSTCVYAGLIPQDEWNGDSFGHAKVSEDKMREVLFGEVA